MPKIPGLEGQQVDTRAYAGTVRTDRVTPNMELAQGLQNFGQGLEQYAQKAKRDADNTAVYEADRKLGEWENRKLYDSQEGAYQVLGKDSMALPERLMPDYDKTASELEAGLTNEEQKQAFRKLSGNRRLDVDRGLQNHISKQISIYEAQAADSYVENAINAAAANYDDPERIATEVDRIEMARRSRASATGEAPEVTEQLIRDDTSKAHVAVINRMLGEGRYAWAGEYLEANKEEIGATVIDEVEKAVRTGKIREESQDHADKIMAGNPKDRSAALADARKINDPDVQEATVDQINQRFNEINQVREENRRNRINDATQIITNGGTVNDIPPAQWNQMSKEERAGLKALQNRGEWYQDDKRWYDFMQTDPDTIATMNLYTEVRPYVDDQHWDMALRHKQSILEAKKAKSTDFDTTIDFQKRLKNSLVENGVFGADLLSGSKDVSDADKTRYARIESEASIAIATFNENKGRKATPQEMEKIIDDIVLRKVYVPRTFTDPERLTIEIQQDDLGRVYIPRKKIPAAEVGDMQRYAESLGKVADDDKLERAYGAVIMGDADGARAILAE